MDVYALIARFYDLEHHDFTEDIEFYLNMVGDGPILEVGCGTGRVMLPLLKAGLDVWGVDSSSQMLSLAKTKLRNYPDAHLIESRIQDLHLDMTFGTIIMPLNFMWHMVLLDAKVRALRILHGHLEAGGMLLIDHSNPHMMAEKGAKGELRERFLQTIPEGDLACFVSTWDEEARQILFQTLFYDITGVDGVVRRTRAEMELAYMFAPELELLLRLGGFQVTHLYGSYALDPYTAVSPNLIAVAHTT